MSVLGGHVSEDVQQHPDQLEKRDNKRTKRDGAKRERRCANPCSQRWVTGLNKFIVVSKVHRDIECSKTLAYHISLLTWTEIIPA